MSQVGAVGRRSSGAVGHHQCGPNGAVTVLAQFGNCRRRRSVRTSDAGCRAFHSRGIAKLHAQVTSVLARLRPLALAACTEARAASLRLPRSLQVAGRAGHGLIGQQARRLQ